MEIKNHLILDEVNSWPSKVLELISDNAPLINNYLGEFERIIDERYNRSMSRPIFRRTNEYEDAFESLIQKVENVLRNYEMIGIHCTRMIDEEILDIQKEGLKPLTRDLATFRIGRAFSKGYITSELEDELLLKEEYDLDERRGMVFFFQCLSSLRNEEGLRKLFGFWGGEAIYMYNKDSEPLKKIGTPCIVFLSMKVSGLNSSYQLGKRMIGIYFQNEFVSHDMDSIIYETVKVIKVIKQSDNLFEMLTGYSTWDEASMDC